MTGPNLTPLTRTGGLAVILCARVDTLAASTVLTAAERADLDTATAALARVKASLMGRVEAADAKEALS